MPPPPSEPGTVVVAINIGLERAANSKTKHGTISSFWIRLLR